MIGWLWFEVAMLMVSGGMDVIGLQWAIVYHKYNEAQKSNKVRQEMDRKGIRPYPLQEFESRSTPPPAPPFSHPPQEDKVLMSFNLKFP